MPQAQHSLVPVVAAGEVVAVQVAREATSTTVPLPQPATWAMVEEMRVAEVEAEVAAAGVVEEQEALAVAGSVAP